MPKPAGKTSLLVALAYDVIRTERPGTIATIADLAEAVKTRAARRRIRYDGPTVARAIAHVAARRPMLGRAPGRPPAGRGEAPGPLAPDDCRRVLAAVRARLATAAGPRPMPEGRRC